MAGSQCPFCDKQTFFRTSKGRKCSNCGWVMELPEINNIDGTGKFCPNCKHNMVFPGKTEFEYLCKRCGAMFYLPSSEE